MKSMLTKLLILTSASLVFASFTADAQTPNTVIRLVVPLAAGGPSDQAARLLARAMSKTLGQEVIVENKSGASGAIGAQAIVAVPADGNTLLFAPSSMTGLPVLLKASPFASMSEFTAIGAVGGNQLCLFVNPGLPVGTAQEFVAHVRANPDKLSYGSSSPLEYLVMAQMMKATGLSMVRVPYRGSAQLMPDLMEGRLHAAFIPPGAGAQHMKTGRLKLLACNAPKRMAGLPEAPTLNEVGISGVNWRAYHLVLAPAKMAPETAARLADAVRRAANEPDVRNEFERLLIPVDVLTPQQTTELIRESERIWAKFVLEAGITPE